MNELDLTSAEDTLNSAIEGVSNLEATKYRRRKPAKTSIRRRSSIQSRATRFSCS